MNWVQKQWSRYEVQTGAYFLKPWEKVVFNASVLCITGAIVYTIYNMVSSFLPHEMTLKKF